MPRRSNRKIPGRASFPLPVSSFKKQEAYSIVFDSRFLRLFLLFFVFPKAGSKYPDLLRAPFRRAVSIFPLPVSMDAQPTKTAEFRQRYKEAEIPLFFRINRDFFSAATAPAPFRYIFCDAVPSSHDPVKFICFLYNFIIKSIFFKW